MIESKNTKILILLQITTVAVFLGRAWQHLVWDAPFRTLLWDEGIMKGIVEQIFLTPWENYITSADTDQAIQYSIVGFGIFYLLCAFMAMIINSWKRVASVFMILGSISLIILAILYCKERFFSIGQFLEYTLQFSSPLFLYLFVNKKLSKERLVHLMKIAIALTFICHGLYAYGYYPRPGYFMEMTMNILGITEEQAVYFLIVAGILDFVIGIGIFLPFKYAKWIIIYAIAWGFFTTIARVWAYVDFAYFLETGKQWIHESVYRVPHFSIPLLVFFMSKLPKTFQN